MYEYFPKRLNIGTLQNCLVKSMPYLMGVALVLSPQITRAQTSLSGTTSNNTPNIGNLSPSQLNNIKPIQQPNIFIDSNRSSQRFFERGRERLFLLPNEASKPILQIDEAVPIDGVNQDDLPKKPADE